MSDDIRDEEPMLPTLADPDFSAHVSRLIDTIGDLAKSGTFDFDGLVEEIDGLFDEADSEGNLEAMRLLWSLTEAVRAEQPKQQEMQEPEQEEAPEEGEEPATGTVTKITTESESEGNEMTLNSSDVPADAVPVAASAASTPFPAIRVGGDVPGYTAGAALTSMDAVHEAMTAKVNSLRGVSGDGEHVLVASIRYETDVPESRILRPGDESGNMRKVRDLVRDPEALRPEALVAAGWCAPTQVIYEVGNPMGTNARPVRNSLPTFTADRGSISWTPPPSTVAALAANAGVTFIKPDAGGNLTYTNPAMTTATTPAETKQCLDIPCGTPSNAVVEAQSICLCFENMHTRAFPEWIRANNDVLLIAQAHYAEQYLLNKIFGGLAAVGVSHRPTTSKIGAPTTPFGAARDMLVMLRLVGSNLRWKNRLAPTAPLQVLLPSWLRDAMAADLVLQGPGDDTISTTYAEIDGYLSNVNVDPIWYIDDVPANINYVVDASDNFASALGFPATANWAMFPTGTFVRLDAGSLDLGVVRTKEDVLKNKYCTFSETFEGLAYMGPADYSTVVAAETPIELLGGFVRNIPETAVVLADAPA